MTNNFMKNKCSCDESTCAKCLGVNCNTFNCAIHTNSKKLDYRLQASNSLDTSRDLKKFIEQGKNNDELSEEGIANLYADYFEEKFKSLTKLSEKEKVAGGKLLQLEIDDYLKNNNLDKKEKLYLHIILDKIKMFLSDFVPQHLPSEKHILDMIKNKIPKKYIDNAKAHPLFNKAIDFAKDLARNDKPQISKLQKEFNLETREAMFISYKAMSELYKEGWKPKVQ